MKKRGISVQMRKNTWKEIRTNLPTSSKLSIAERLENYEGVSIALYNTLNSGDKLFEKPKPVAPISPLFPDNGYPDDYHYKTILLTVQKFIKYSGMKVFTATSNNSFSIRENAYQSALSRALRNTGLLDPQGNVLRRELELVVDIIKLIFQSISENLDTLFSLASEENPSGWNSMMFLSRVLNATNIDRLNTFMVKSFSTGQGFDVFKDAINENFSHFRVDGKLYKSFNSELAGIIVQSIKDLNY